MRLMRFLLRLFGFGQWAAAMAIGALCAVAHVETLNEANDSGAAESITDLASAFGPMMVSLHQTLPGLLVSILLLMSAIYCDQAGKASARPHRNAKPSSAVGSPGDARPSSPRSRVD